MGLQRADAREFYAATAGGSAIQREKRAILDGDGERRVVVTHEGHRAAAQFARLLGLKADDGGSDDEVGWRVFNRALGLALEPDLLLVEPPDWSLVWANVCFPSRWSLDGKAGRPLAWIHDAVPDLNSELGSKIAAFFSRLNPGEGWRRANWGLSASCGRDQHPRVTTPTLRAGHPAEQIYVRIEDQHLVKLPETGVIVFGIRVASFAWSVIRENPAVTASLLDQLRSMSPEIARYKGISEVIPSMTENPLQLGPGDLIRPNKRADHARSSSNRASSR